MAATKKTLPFREYWLALTKEQRALFAERCGSTPGYLSIVAGNPKKNRASANVALAIEIESNRTCRVEEIAPHINWGILLSRPRPRRKPAA